MRKRKLISWLMFEIILCLGVYSIWKLYQPYFIPDELHIGFTFTLTAFCVSWLGLWTVWLDKMIDKPVVG